MLVYFSGGVPRLVGVVGVDHEEEGLPAREVRGGLQELRPLREDPRGEPVLFRSTVLGVGEVLKHDLLGVRGVGAADERLF
jgi:hypothetical protein